MVLFQKISFLLPVVVLAAAVTAPDSLTSEERLQFIKGHQVPNLTVQWIKNDRTDVQTDTFASALIGEFTEIGINVKVQPQEADAFLAVSPTIEYDRMTINPEWAPDYMLSGFAEFMAADATADFSPVDKMAWMGRHMFQKRAFNELVVLNGYPLEAVCQNKAVLDAAGPLLPVHGGFLMAGAQHGSSQDIALAFDASTATVVDAQLDAVARAAAQAYGVELSVVESGSRNPLEPFCTAGRAVEWKRDAAWAKILAEASLEPAGIRADLTLFDGTRPDMTDQRTIVVAPVLPSYWTPIGQGEAGAMLSQDLFDLVATTPSDIYLVTADPVPGLEAITEIWARCNTGKPDTLMSACQATLADSPYPRHQDILEMISGL